MDSFAPLLTYAAALAVAAVIPGPGVAALVGQALGNGLRPALFFLIGITLFGIGLLGEYVGRVYQQVRHRPRYLVDAILERDVATPQ